MEAQIAVLKLLINYSDHLGIVVQREEEKPTYESLVASPFVKSEKSLAQIVNASSADVGALLVAMLCCLLMLHPFRSYSHPLPDSRRRRPHSATDRQ